MSAVLSTGAALLKPELSLPVDRHISGLGEPVVAVGLVVPRPDVFDASLVRYLLVVATPAEVRLYAVTFGPAPGTHEAEATDGATVPVLTGVPEGGAESSSPGSSVHGRLHVHETALVYPTGGVIAHKVAGSASGRIFLAGARARSGAGGAGCQVRCGTISK